MANAPEQFFADLAVKLSGKQIAHVRKWIEFRKQVMVSPGRPLRNPSEGHGDDFTPAQGKGYDRVLKKSPRLSF